MVVLINAASMTHTSTDMFVADLSCNGGSLRENIESPDYRPFRKQCCAWLREHTEKGSCGVAYIKRKGEPISELIQFFPSKHIPNSGKFIKLVF